MPESTPRREESSNLPDAGAKFSDRYPRNAIYKRNNASQLRVVNGDANSDEASSEISPTDSSISAFSWASGESERLDYPESPTVGYSTDREQEARNNERLRSERLRLGYYGDVTVMPPSRPRSSYRGMDYVPAAWEPRPVSRPGTATRPIEQVFTPRYSHDRNARPGSGLGMGNNLPDCDYRGHRGEAEPTTKHPPVLVDRFPSGKGMPESTAKKLTMLVDRFPDEVTKPEPKKKGIVKSLTGIFKK